MGDIIPSGLPWANFKPAEFHLFAWKNKKKGDKLDGVNPRQFIKPLSDP